MSIFMKSELICAVLVIDELSVAPAVPVEAVLLVPLMALTKLGENVELETEVMVIILSKV